MDNIYWMMINLNMFRWYCLIDIRKLYVEILVYLVLFLLYRDGGIIC